MSSSETRGRVNGPTRNTNVAKPKLADSRSWRKYVNQLPDDELIAVVRGMVSVDRAVAGYRGRL
jgi:hypothetical protein